jgi:hypothetical protein
MLLQSVRRALGREPEAHSQGRPEAVRAPAGPNPPVVRRESDSHPAPRSTPSRGTPTPKPARTRTERKAPSGHRLIKIERAPVLFGNDADRRGAAGHAKHLMECLRASGFRTGDIIVSRKMQASYEVMCDRLGWHPLPWSGANGIGKHLRLLCGGKKDHRDSFVGQRTRRRERVYILPPWPARAQASPDNVTALAAHAAPERSAA